MTILVTIFKILLTTFLVLPLGMYTILPIVYHFNKKMTPNDLGKINLFVLWTCGILAVIILCLGIYIGPELNYLF